MKHVLEDDVKQPEEAPVKRRKFGEKPQRPLCPYLGTINREMLDFDFEKLCSVTLSNFHIYACLVCGKYFQGRGKSSHAYFHSLHLDHHVFIHLENMKVYCLPDDYEVEDPSLEDIKHVLNPTFAKGEIASLDMARRGRSTESRGLGGVTYIPGMVGLNNIKMTDYVSVVVQALAHVSPLRDFFLDVANYGKVKSRVVRSFGELVRKMWNPRSFKGHVSPHEFVQAVNFESQKKFVPSIQSDPMHFLVWLLNNLHFGLRGSASKPSVVTDTFQGAVRVTTETKTSEGDRDVSSRAVPFMYLSLDVPPPPLFQDEQQRNIIPQVPLFQILGKYDGVTQQELIDGSVKRHIIVAGGLPRFLVLQIGRFTKNNFFTEKNPTIVNFPVKNLEMKDYMEGGGDEMAPTKYDLVANICHSGKPDEGQYHVHVRNKVNDQWYEIQDLTVTETMPQVIAVSEAYIQIYERQPVDRMDVVASTPLASTPSLATPVAGAPKT